MELNSTFSPWLPFSPFAPFSPWKKIKKKEKIQGYSYFFRGRCDIRVIWRRAKISDCVTLASYLRSMSLINCHHVAHPADRKQKILFLKL